MLIRNEGHEYAVSCVEWYTVDNGLFFSGGFDKTVRVWDPNEMKVRIYSPVTEFTRYMLLKYYSHLYSFVG